MRSPFLGKSHCELLTDFTRIMTPMFGRCKFRPLHLFAASITPPSVFYHRISPTVLHKLSPFLDFIRQLHFTEAIKHVRVFSIYLHLIFHHLCLLSTTLIVWAVYVSCFSFQPLENWLTPTAEETILKCVIEVRRSNQAMIHCVFNLFSEG